MIITACAAFAFCDGCGIDTDPVFNTNNRNIENEMLETAINGFGWKVVGADGEIFCKDCQNRLDNQG